jgi:hypothetical protein
MLGPQIDDVLGARPLLLPQEPFKPQPLGHAGILAEPVLYHAFDIGADQIGERRLARCRLIDGQPAIHFGFGLARPGLRFLSCAAGRALEWPAFAPDLELPLALRLFPDGRHCIAPLESQSVPRSRSGLPRVNLAGKFCRPNSLNFLENEWRTREDSNLWPLPSEGSALSS